MNRLLKSFITIAVITCLAGCTSPANKQQYENENQEMDSKTAGREIEGFTPVDKNTENIYPAYINKNGTRMWGYIDKQGKFIIPPAYEWVEDFNDHGLAKVSLNGYSAIIDKSEKMVIEPIYDYISDFLENLVVASRDNYYEVLDTKGQIVIKSKDHIGDFHNGLATIGRPTQNGSYLYGYIDVEGKAVLEPVFEQAGSFQNNKALVKIKDKKYAVIDKKGTILMELNYKNVQQLSDDILIYTDENNLMGYITYDGHKLTDARFIDAHPFKDGFAVVNDSKDYSTSKYGVIDTTGNFVIPSQYASIRYIGENMFAASIKAFDSYCDDFCAKSIVNSKGVRLTDYKYYDIGGFNDGITSVSEDTLTYFIDKNGNKIDCLPTVDGTGTMTVLDGLIKVVSDGELYYYTTEGKIVWHPEMIQKFANGTEIKTLKYSPDRCMLIYYPQISNMTDSSVEKILNEKLRKVFVGDNPVSLKEDGLYTENINIGFTAIDNKDLLILKKAGYYYPIGAAHGTPSMISFHINTKTGRFYKLSDLFKKDAPYLMIITDIINRQIKEKINDEDSMLIVSEIGEIAPDQQYMVTENGLTVFFQPYEIAAYAAGFPEFEIPFSQIIDLIDTNGEFWNSFDKMINN